MSLTVTIPGAVLAEVGATAPATLVLELGVPGPIGATGATGEGVPVGGTTGQVLAKIDGTNYNTEWVNVEGDYLPLAGGAMDSGAEVTISDGSNHDSELAGWGLGVELSNDHAQGTTVEYNGLNVYGTAGASVNVNPTQITLSDNTDVSATLLKSGLQIVTGTVEGERTVTELGSTSISVISEITGDYSLIETNALSVVNSVGQFTSISINGISFTNGSQQSTAFLGYESPAFTGVPTAPSATLGDDSTQIATTAFVQDAIIAGSAHAESLVANVRNNTGSSLAAFTVVYISGAVGNKAAVAKAQANSEATSSGTFAVTETAIANNADGNVISAGVLSGVNTSAFTDGDKLYLSPTVAGGMTTTKPSAPNHMVYVGVVTRSHPTLGTVSVRIQNGYELEELHNVAIASVADKDSLFYESSTSLWKNYTPANARTNLGLGTASTLASSAVAQTANNLSDLASASTARTNLGLGTMATQSSATYATVASPSLTGTPLSTTASANTNTTQIATTAYVVGQAGTGTPIVDGTAAVGTSLLYSRQDHVHPTDTSRAGTDNNLSDLANPSTARTNLGVPYATTAEKIVGTSTSTVLSPLIASLPTSSMWGSIPFNNLFSYTSGTGASVTPSGSSTQVLSISLQAPNASTVGYASRLLSMYYGNSLNGLRVNWAKQMGFSVRFSSPIIANTYVDTKVRVVFGRDGLNTPTLITNFTTRCFGIEYDHNTKVLTVFAHNGTTLSTSVVTFTAVNFAQPEVTCISDGTGTVNVYVNGTLSGSVSGAASTEYSVASITCINFEIQNTSTSATGSALIIFSNPKILF